MSAFATSEFNHHVHRLSAEMLRAAGNYLDQNGFGALSHSSLISQMSSDIDQVAVEILTFGGDVWPQEHHDAPPTADIISFPNASVPAKPAIAAVANLKINWHPDWRNMRGYFFALLATALATTLGIMVMDALNITGLGFVYLVGIVIVGMLYGLFPSLLAYVSGVCSYLFFFVAPYASFQLDMQFDNRADATRFGLFCFSGLITALFVAWSRKRMAEETGIAVIRTLHPIEQPGSAAAI